MLVSLIYLHPSLLNGSMSTLKAILYTTQKLELITYTDTDGKMISEVEYA